MCLSNIYCTWKPRFSSVAQSCLTLWPHGLQHTRLPCPSPTPGAYSNSCPWSWWCHPTISSSAIPFSSAFNLSQHQDLSQWESSLHHVAKVTFYKCKRGHTTSKLDALQWLLFSVRLHYHLFFSANSAALHGGVFESSDSSLPPISLCPKLLSCWFSGPHTNQFILASGPWYVFVFALNCPPSQPFPIQPNLSNSLIYGDWLTWPLHRKVFCNHIVWIRLNHCSLGMFQYNTILSLYVLHFKRFICVLKSGRL